MTNVSNWVLGFCSVIMGLAGLFVASHAGHGVGYYGGLAIFLFADCTICKTIVLNSNGDFHLDETF